MTQIRINEKQKKELDLIKVHPRDTYEYILGKLLNYWENKTKYDGDFRDFVKGVLDEHHPEFKIMHIQECHAGLQVFCEESNIILITHDELKMWSVLLEEGLEPSKESYSLLDYRIFQTIDAKIR